MIVGPATCRTPGCCRPHRMRSAWLLSRDSPALVIIRKAMREPMSSDASCSPQAFQLKIARGSLSESTAMNV